MSSEPIRPTKKQRELLNFIEAFINEHGYSPSYREIMSGLNYTSVATVALHVNSLIKRGHLLKRDGKARSLEVRDASRNKNEKDETHSTDDSPEDNENWLVARVNELFELAEASPVKEVALENLSVVIAALKVLGLQEAADTFVTRLSELKLQQATVAIEDTSLEK